MAGNALIRDYVPLSEAIYYAPRGRLRLYGLAAYLSQHYLQPTDHLIGVIGAEGSGKSTIIKGLFPGLELTNDDDGINMPTSRAFSFDPDDQFCGHTFHIDMRYEMAFHQVHEIVDVVKEILHAKRRIVIEHFDLLYSHLGYNAQILFVIGEDLRVYRPNVFGPSPIKLREMALSTLKYRLMAHTAEDIVGKILQDDYGYRPDKLHSELHHGFVIRFDHLPDINIGEVEKKALEIIASGVRVEPGESDHVLFNGVPFYCTGKRCHVKNTKDIENFRLLKSYKYNPLTKSYGLVGIVGDKAETAELEEELPPAQSEDFEENSEPGDKWIGIGPFVGKMRFKN